MRGFPPVYLHPIPTGFLYSAKMCLLARRATSADAARRLGAAPITAQRLAWPRWVGQLAQRLV